MKLSQVGLFAGLLISTASIIGIQSPAEAGWDPIKKTPLDPGTWGGGARDTRDYIHNRSGSDGLNRTSFNLRNKCSAYLNVKVEFQNMSNRWETRNYTFSPGERAFLFNTNNRYVYVSAKGRGSKKHLTWNRFRVDTGARHTDYTQSLSCN